MLIFCRSEPQSITVPIYKKGDETDCTNYRDISLLSTVYKILCHILHAHRKLLGIINENFDATGQQLIIYSAFSKYFLKNGNTMKQCISYL